MPKVLRPNLVGTNRFGSLPITYHRLFSIVKTGAIPITLSVFVLPLQHLAQQLIMYSTPRPKTAPPGLMAI
jgi:hypothetical protein